MCASLLWFMQVRGLFDFDMLPRVPLMVCGLTPSRAGCAENALAGLATAGPQPQGFNLGDVSLDQPSFLADVGTSLAFGTSWCVSGMLAVVLETQQIAGLKRSRGQLTRG